MNGIPHLRMVVMLSVIASALLAADRFLARTETQELAGEAEAAYRQGLSLAKEHRYASAVESFRKAHSLRRENPAYERELGGALAAVGKTMDAEPLIMEALDRSPTEGVANLAAARLMVQEGRNREAASFFHRAIYGTWNGANGNQRTATRFELIELFAEQKQHQEMLAELISLEAETGNDVAVRKRLARLLLVAGAPARAVTVYQQLADVDSQDGEALMGLGEAELGSGQYHAARNAFVRAAMHTRGAAIQARLQLLDTVTSLDPTPRRLTSNEKYRRSLRILELTRADLDQLAQANPPNDSGEIQTLLRRAEEIGAGHAPAHVSNEIAEQVLSVAEQLWAARIRWFGSATRQDEEALRLILERIAA
jgi:Flp pilus assembly protein TadD